MVGLLLFQLALLFVLLTCLAGTLVGASVGATRVRQRGPRAAALCRQFTEFVYRRAR